MKRSETFRVSFEAPANAPHWQDAWTHLEGTGSVPRFPPGHVGHAEPVPKNKKQLVMASVRWRVSYIFITMQFLGTQKRSKVP